MPVAIPTAASVGALTENEPGEHRVALDPSAVTALTKRGHSVHIQAGAGDAASFSDAAYVSAGATIGTRVQVLERSDVLAVVRTPDAALQRQLRSGHAVIGLLDPLGHLPMVSALAKRGVTLVAFELLPRTLSRGQSMDALSSQASAAGYRAAIVAADSFGRYLSMMITASGTAVPAKAIVIGTGVAGLQAIATLKRLGAVVTGYDVRAASRREVESLGATFMTSSISQGAENGGYAKALTATERTTQQAELEAALIGFDIIITTAKVPGHTPPLLVSEATVAALRPGSVCVDLGSSDRGGNVAGSVVNLAITTGGGVTVIGAGELAADLPASASQMYGRNVAAVIAALLPKGVLAFDPGDELQRGLVVCTDGEIVNSAVRDALKLPPTPHTPTPEKVLVS